MSWGTGSSLGLDDTSSSHGSSVNEGLEGSSAGWANKSSSVLSGWESGILAWESGVSIEVSKVITVGTVSVSALWVDVNWLWLNPMSSVITKVDSGWGNVIDSTSSLGNWISGIVLSKRVVVVSWESFNSVVNTTWSIVGPRVHGAILSSVGKGILEWLVSSTILLILPLHVEITSWTNSLLSHVDMVVLQLLNLMLSVWDDGVGLPDWVVDLGLLNWSWVSSKWVWNWNWGVLSDMWTLAGSDNSIAQVSLKWNDLSVFGLESIISGVPVNHLLAVGKLDPSGSNTGSNLGGGSGEGVDLGIELDEFSLSLVLLKSSEVGGKVLLSGSTHGKIVVDVDGLGCADQKSNSVR